MRGTAGAIRSAVMVLWGPGRVSVPVTRAKLGDADATSTNDSTATKLDLRIFTSRISRWSDPEWTAHRNEFGKEALLVTNHGDVSAVGLSRRAVPQLTPVWAGHLCCTSVALLQSGKKTIPCGYRDQKMHLSMGQAAAGGSRCFDHCNTWSGSTIRGRSIDSLGMAVADAQLL